MPLQLHILAIIPILKILWLVPGTARIVKITLVIHWV